MVVDLPRCAAILSSRVPRHLPLVRLAVRLHHSQDLEIIVLRHQLGVLRWQVDRPGLTDADGSLLGVVAAALARPSRAAGHPRHAAASAAAPRRLTLDPATATAGPTIDLSGASPTHAAPRSQVSDLGLPPHPRRTERARPSHRCVHGPADPQQRPNRPRTHTLQSDLVAVPAVACDFATSTPSRCAGSTCCCSSTSLPGPCTSQRSRATLPASGPAQPPGTCCCKTATNWPTPVRSCATAQAQFIDAFDEIFTTERIKVLKTPVRTPVANAFAQRWIRTLQASSPTAPSSGTNGNPRGSSSTTSITTTRTGPTARSTSDLRNTR